MFPANPPVEEKATTARNRPSPGHALGRLLAALLLGLLIMGAAASIAIIAAGGPEAKPTLIGLLTHAGFLILSLAIMLIMDKGNLLRFGFRSIEGAFPWVAVTGSLGLGAAATGVSQLLPESTADPAAGFSTLQIILLIWIWASLAEEIFVRGLIQSFLNSLRDHGFTLGNFRLSLPVIFAACFFSAMHLGLLGAGASFTTVLPILIFALCLGLLAGYYREKSLSLIPAVLIHMSANIGGTLTAWAIE